MLKLALFASLIILAAAVPSVPNHKTCRVPKATFARGEKILSPLPHTLISQSDLPSDFNWGNVSGKNFLTVARNQHIPQYCGSCWAHGTSSSISDRLRIVRDNKGEINISPQAIINAEIAGSCEGGNPGPVYEYAHDEGLAEDSCQIYTAQDPSDDKAQTDLGQCETCVPGKGAQFLPGSCSAVTNYTRWKVSEYGSVSGADKMKAEIFKRGPISCGIAVTDKFELYTSGIYSEFSLFPSINHELAVVGWGVENGVEYWIGRNSWGTFWGENGFFRIKMHNHNLAIESDCTWGVPIAEGFQKVLASHNEIKSDKPVFKHHNPDHPCHITPPGPRPQHVISPLPHTYINSNDLPTSFDIRNVSGVNYASPDRQQHNPNYCGSCWAMSSASSLSDRFNYIRKDIFPEINLAPQVLVNCVTGNSSKGCSGGQPDSAYEWILKNGGLVDETCMNFMATDLPCVPENICRNCEPGKGCWAQKDYKTYKIKEHGWVTGEQEMMAEIFARGPVACSIAVTAELDASTGGIFKDTTGARGDDHDVSIAGWGEENGEKYWIIRNSWGTFWNERGWFRLAKGIDNLGVETQGCAWAVPDI